MAEAKAKLAQYRAKKLRVPLLRSNNKEPKTDTVEEQKVDSRESDECSDTTALVDSAQNPVETPEPAAKREYTRSDIYILLLKLALFFILWGLFIEWQLGSAYFVCALIVLVCLNTSKRRRSGPSPYSVFNPNCERLEGQFTAEQFERELRGGGIPH